MLKKLLLPLFLGLAFFSKANVIKVNDLGDLTPINPGGITLRNAITSAVQFDTIILEVSGIITLDTLSPTIVINKTLDIYGYNPINHIIDGRKVNRMFEISALGTDTVRFHGITFGNMNNTTALNVFLQSSGNAAFARCVFVNNINVERVYHKNSGFLGMFSCSFFDNTNKSGPGFKGCGFFNMGGDAEITNCTFYNNSTINADGGAIYVNGGQVKIIHTTIYNNNAGGPGNVGGIYLNAGIVNLQNSIVAYNIGGTNPDVSTIVPFNSQGGNVIYDASGASGFIGSDFLFADPMLTGIPVTDGYGMMYVPISNNFSVCVDSALPIGGLFEDQRGFPRILDGKQTGLPNPDIGAVEFTPFSVTSANGGLFAGTLPQAMQDISISSGVPPYCVEFNITGGGVPYIIPLTGIFPNIDQEIFIDGYTQPGSKVAGPSGSFGSYTPADIGIQVDGSGLSGNGLTFMPGADNSRVKGLSITNFIQDGIVINNCTNIKLTGNYIGVDGYGTLPVSNNKGVSIINGANHLIGGDLYEDKNIISGNLGNGIEIQNSNSNFIFNNYIGVSKYGTTSFDSISNGFNGIELFNSNFNVIGGAALREGNLISGNKQSGIFLVKSSDNNIAGNKIGTNDSAKLAIPNWWDGITLVDTSYRNSIGVAVKKGMNIISGNLGDGVHIFNSDSNHILNNYIGLNYTGIDTLPNHANGVVISQSKENIVGGSMIVERNYIAGNQLSGVGLALGASKNIILNNFIGTDTSGSIALGNKFEGIFIDSAFNNSIGDGTITGRNLISGNISNGIALNRADSNYIAGNFIGTNISGTIVLGNALNGISLFESRENLIGDTTPDAMNLISGNAGNGIFMDTSSDNSIVGNIIGAGFSGNAALPNGYNGIELFRSSLNNIGKVEANGRNVISGNAQYGIILHSQSNGNGVVNNLIGTNSIGSAALGNGFTGISIYNNANNNFIGDATPSGKNIISGNNGGGINIDMFSNNNNVSGNYIGTNLSGITKVPNVFEGVRIGNGSVNNYIGNGTLQGRNIISGNNLQAVKIDSANSNYILKNYLGVNSIGTDTLANSVGIDIEASNTIVVERNIISGNNWTGVVLKNADSCYFYKNVIGTDSGAFEKWGNRNQLIPNAGGIYFWPTISVLEDNFNNYFEENIIANNTGPGIYVADSFAQGNEFFKNSIYNNTGGGILIAANAQGGVIPPVIDSVTSDSLVHGSASSFAFIQIYVDPDTQGKMWIDTVIADVNGKWSVKIPLPSIGNHLTALQDSSNNTSAFSDPFVGYTISGNVYYGDTNTKVNPGKVNLYRFASGAKPFKLVDSFNVGNFGGPSGLYFFPPRYPGKFLLLAKVDTLNYPNTLPTYLGNKAQWFKADVLTLSGKNVNNKNIILPILNTLTGNGTITGKVREGNLTGKTLGPGDPLEGADVSLIDKSTNSPVAFAETETSTEDTGRFTFNNVPNGEYYIHVDYAGIPIDTNTIFDISDTSLTINNIVVTVDSDYIYFGEEDTGGTFIANLIKHIDLSVYPNPFNDFVLIEYGHLIQEDITIQIIDISGSIVDHILFKNQLPGKYRYAYSNEELPTGNYVLEIKGKSFLRSIQLQHIK